MLLLERRNSCQHSRGLRTEGYRQTCRKSQVSWHARTHGTGKSLQCSHYSLLPSLWPEDPLPRCPHPWERWKNSYQLPWTGDLESWGNWEINVELNSKIIFTPTQSQGARWLFPNGDILRLWRAGALHMLLPTQILPCPTQGPHDTTRFIWP